MDNTDFRAHYYNRSGAMNSKMKNETGDLHAVDVNQNTWVGVPDQTSTGSKDGVRI